MLKNEVHFPSYNQHGMVNVLFKNFRSLKLKLRGAPKGHLFAPLLELKLMGIILSMILGLENSGKSLSKNTITLP